MRPSYQGEHFLTAENVIVRHCSSSVQYEKKLIHLWNSHCPLMSSQQVSPVIFSQQCRNVSITSGRKLSDSSPLPVAIARPRCVWTRVSFSPFSYLKCWANSLLISTVTCYGPYYWVGGLISHHENLDPILTAFTMWQTNRIIVIKQTENS